MKRLSVLLTCLLFLAQALPAHAQTHLKNIRFWTAPDHTRIVFDVDKLPEYKISQEGEPRHLIVELSNTYNWMRYRSFKIADGLIGGVRIRPTNEEKKLGIVIDLMNPARLDVFTLKKFQDKPERLVIDVLRPIKKENQKKEAAVVSKAKATGQRIVLIDPGHGGEDPGAIGRRLKLKEKKVVLNIAKRLYYLLKKEPGIKPYLTRHGDYYLSLGKRTRLAEKYKADLMISIHANASTSSKLKGASVYYLSPKGASDKASELLARKENAADLIGGNPISQDKTVNAILIDMLQTSSVNDSIKLGHLTLKHLKKLSQVPTDKKLHSAPFAVLKSPATPSILVETAFLSNRKDERALANPKFRKQVAYKLLLAVKDYFKQTAIKVLPVKKAAAKKKRVHVVKRGETIWRIAEKYGISPQALRKTNGMGRSNIIKVGQKIFIPR